MDVPTNGAQSHLLVCIHSWIVSSYLCGTWQLVWHKVLVVVEENAVLKKMFGWWRRSLYRCIFPNGRSTDQHLQNETLVFCHLSHTHTHTHQSPVFCTSELDYVRSRWLGSASLRVHHTTHTMWMCWAHVVPYLFVSFHTWRMVPAFGRHTIFDNYGVCYQF